PGTSAEEPAGLAGGGSERADGAELARERGQTTAQLDRGRARGAARAVERRRRRVSAEFGHGLSQRLRRAPVSADRGRGRPERALGEREKMLGRGAESRAA